jgi:hypothetical protein
VSEIPLREWPIAAFFNNVVPSAHEPEAHWTRNAPLKGHAPGQGRPPVRSFRACLGPATRSAIGFRPFVRLALCLALALPPPPPSTNTAVPFSLTESGD